MGKLSGLKTLRERSAKSSWIIFSWSFVDVQDTSNILSDQSLTTDDVPMLVDKCINFVATYGNTASTLCAHFIQPVVLFCYYLDAFGRVTTGESYVYKLVLFEEPGLTRSNSGKTGQ